MGFSTATAVLRLSAGILLFLVPAAGKAESLPSWNDSESRNQILSFIDAVVDPASPDFVPADERIAVFDNDGTLWSEQPAYFQLLFAIVKDWIATARHPKSGKLYTEMVYQPMLELLDYLRANEFKTYIVSGGGIEFKQCLGSELH